MNKKSGPKREYAGVLPVNFTQDQWDYMERWQLKFNLPKAMLIRDALEAFMEQNKLEQDTDER